MSNSIVSKPSQEAIQAATKAAIVEAYTIVYTNDAGKKIHGGYDGLKNQGVPYNVLAGAVSGAILITAGVFKITEAGRLVPVENAKVQYDLLGKMLSPTAWKKFRGMLKTAKHGALVTPKGATEEGVTFFNNRMVDAGPAFNTNKEMVDAFLVSFATGKAPKIKGVKGLKFAKVEAKRA